MQLKALDPKYGQTVINDGIISYQPGTGGLSTKPNPTPVHDTRIGEEASYTSEGQMAQAAHAVTKNNSKKIGQQLFNMSAAAAIPSGGNGTNQALSNRGTSALGQRVADTAPYAPAVKPAPQPTYNADIKALTDNLVAQQEAERARFERKRMADRISRMGFALGNLIGAGGGNTDASAITLDDGTKTVGEYRKDMDEINKQNQAAYQRALDMIYRKEDQDYKNAVLEENIRNHQATLEANKAYRDEMADYRRSQLDAQIANNQTKNQIAQQNADTNAAKAAKTGSSKTGGVGGYRVVKTDANGNILWTTERTPTDNSNNVGANGDYSKYQNGSTNNNNGGGKKSWEDKKVKQ